MIGIYAEVSESIVKGGTYLYSIQKINSYSHNIAAVGGFWDAQISIPVGQYAAEDWYEKGLGRQIHIKNHLGGTVWKGFANNISITAGSQTLTRGPLLDIVNRAASAYTPRDFSVYPPVDGTQTVTPLTNNTISQDEFGIFEKWTAAGATTEAVALAVRDLYLAQNKLPKTTGDFSISGVGQPLSLTLDLLGNVHWLTVYPYNNFTPSVITAYQKLIAVLNANSTINPGVFSTDYSYVDANAYAMEQLEDRNRYAWDIVNEVLSIGNGTNDIRRLFGIYELDKVYYSQIPLTVSYGYRLSSQRQLISDYNTNAIVFPWDIRPGKWIHTYDWLVGRIMDDNNLDNDPRNKFIENVNFSMPYTVGITGSPYDELAQMLSKITYTGGIY